MKRASLILILVASVGAGAVAYYTHGRGGPPITVLTSPITRGDIVDSVGSTGTLQAVTTVQVGSQVSGNILELDADFNSIVKKGQVLAKLDPSLLQAQLDQSQAALNQQRANLTKAQSDLDRTKVQLLDAQQKYSRARELNARTLVPQSDLDAAKIAVDTAQAALTSQAATVKQSEAAVAQSEAQVNQNRVNVEHTIITAPIDGIVIQRSVDVGQTVAASMQAPTLFVLAADLTKMQISANIDESDVGRIRPGQRVTFRVDAYPSRQFDGTVTQIRLQPTVQSNVTTYGTMIDVPNPDLELKPGMTANLKVEISRRTDVFQVPNAAVRFRPGQDLFAALNQPVPRDAPAGGRGGPARGEPARQDQRGNGRATGATLTAGTVAVPARPGATTDALFPPLPPSVATQGRVWFYVDKQLKPVTVRLGLTDGATTELVTGELPPGAEVVTGVTGLRSVRPQLAGANGNPFGTPGPPPGGFGGPPPGGFGGPPPGGFGGPGRF